MRARYAALAVILVVGCASPDGKLEPNASPNNANNMNSANSGSNNANNNNVAPNNQIPPNIAPNSMNRPFVDVSEFDNSCEWDSECELTGLGGDVCGCGQICSVPVASSQIPAIEEAVAAVDCSDVDPEDISCPAVGCEQSLAVCSSGVCSSVGYVEIFADEFDRSCEVDADCVLIQTGVICPACDCGRSAIHVAELAEYESRRGNPDCNPGPQACNCEPPNMAYCNGGTCDVTFGG